MDLIVELTESMYFPQCFNLIHCISYGVLCKLLPRSIYSSVDTKLVLADA